MDLHKQIIDQRVRTIVTEPENLDWFKEEHDEERQVSKAFVLL